MPNIIDEICPTYVGEQRIRMLANENSLRPRAFVALTIDVDYSACLPQGVVLPLELTIVAPTAQNFRRLVYTRAAPSQISFQPREGGKHVIRLGEVGHNRWFGYIEIEVAGEPATRDTVT